MYRPSYFREDRLEILHALIRAPSAGAAGDGRRPRAAGQPLPMLVDPAASSNGTLRGHLARANDQIAALRACGQALVIFQGPQAYVSPSWYPSKAEHGKVRADLELCRRPCLGYAEGDR